MNALSTPGVIRTFTGRYVRLLQPDPEQVCIEDIAHALANECRFGGHTRRFYSVAEHSVMGSYFVAAEERLRFLLHDAAEAYLKDLPKPLKMLPEFRFYNELEERWAGAIAARFCIDGTMSPRMKAIDKAMLRTEQRDLMGRAPEPSDDTVTLPLCIPQFAPVDIEATFLNLFGQYGGKGIGILKPGRVRAGALTITEVPA